MELLIPLLLSAGWFALLFSNSDDTDNDSPEPDIINPLIATDGDDVGVLTGGADIFAAGAGNDSVDGLAGSDTISGEAGQDTLIGGEGKDVLYGGDGYDNLSGGAWHDTIFGGTGFDDINGGAGKDDLYGDEGKDLLEGGDGDDVMNGGAWVDGLFGGAGNDVQYGGSGDDMLIGGDGDDYLLGDGGDDLLIGGDGYDVLIGGDGDDVLIGSQIMNRELTSADYQSLRAGTLGVDEDGDEFFANWGLSGTDTETGVQPSNNLFGGAGNDGLFIGTYDNASGGEGFDDFILGDWIEGGPFNLATISDFQTGEDIIIVALAEDNADAEIGIETVPDGEIGAGTFITLDGVRIARVDGIFDTFDGLASDVLTTTYAPVA